MPEHTPTGAVDVVERQVRRVRRRKNSYELQRGLYLTITAAAVAATIVLPLALFAPAGLFGIVAWTTLAVLGAVTLVLARGARLSAASREWGPGSSPRTRRALPGREGEIPRIN